jgi:hypothetical protein
VLRRRQAMVQCPQCHEQVEPTPNAHCPNCDSNLSVTLFPTAVPEGETVEPFRGFRFLVIVGFYCIAVLSIAVLLGIRRWDSPSDALMTTLNNMFFMGLSMPFIQPGQGVMFLAFGVWLLFTKSRRTLILCSIVYSLIIVLMASTTLYFFNHCGPACP